ncbi:hypothetical protein BRAO375_4620002 [Bradyrhizobium sp. ORS 375]|nr:hypothetical protein BRAO375_4620002 [Bradyrhizobium sp. ORS 375]
MRLGKVVRLVSFEARQSIDRKARLISLLSVSLGLCKSGVAKDGHDHLCRRASLSQTTAGSLAQAVRLTIKRQACVRNGIAHPLAEAVNAEGLAIGGRDDRHVVTLCDGQG